MFIRVYILEISNVNDIETKGQTFRYRSLLSERKQNVLVWSAYYRNKSKTYWFGPKNSLMRANCFRFGPKSLGRSKAIWFGSLIIGTKAKCFDLFCLLSELKQIIFIWSAYYRNESKTFWFGLHIIGTKAKQFDLLLKLSQLYSIRRFLFDPKTDFLWGFCANWILIDPLQYLSSCSDFGFELAEIFIIEKDSPTRRVGSTRLPICL